MNKVILSLIFFSFSLCLTAQVEHLPITNPVYKFLEHLEIKGVLPHFSSSNLPLQKAEVILFLKLANNNSKELNANEVHTLELYLKEFEIISRNNAVIIFSGTDFTQVLSNHFLSNDEKFVYHYKDSNNTVNLSPLGSFDALLSKNNENIKLQNASIINFGIRLNGSISQHFGYYIQATNGMQLSGVKSLALQDDKLSQNIKFADLNSDIDFTESHLRIQYDLFYAIIGRESRQIGSGISQRIFNSTSAAPYDALSLGARFEGFEYRFTHGSLLSSSETSALTSVAAVFPTKYIATHNFTLKPSWGEFGYWESIIYSKRAADLAYLNPLGFFKSLEHALHDRDNSLMGVYATLRPFANFQLKASYLLDDIIFDRIGTGYWSNKTAWNLAAQYVLPISCNIGLEYSRVEPFTFSHFDTLNNYTNDSRLIGSDILPNSDAITFITQFWYGNRYPITLKISRIRHGDNITDSLGNVIKNVGANPMTLSGLEPLSKIIFLDGIRHDATRIQLEAGWEIIRGFNIQAIYQIKYQDNTITNFFRCIFRFEDF